MLHNRENFVLSMFPFYQRISLPLPHSVSIISVIQELVNVFINLTYHQCVLAVHLRSCGNTFVLPHLERRHRSLLDKHSLGFSNLRKKGGISL